MFAVLTKISSILILSLFCALPASAENKLPPLTHGLTAIPTGTHAPPLRLPDLDEEMVDIQDFAGKVVVVNFWATWCPPCRREMPSLERLREQTANDGVMILAVNIGEDTDTVFSFLGTIEPAPNFPLLFDLEAESLGDWRVQGLPTTYVVAPDGTLAYRAVGGREFDHLEIIKQLRSLQPSSTDR